MSTYVGSNNKVNGSTNSGEFLTGNMDFFSIATLVPMAATNVTTPVSQLYTQQGYTTWQPVTVTDGAGVEQTYSTQASYEDALAKQANLNLLLQVFSQRANPVAISVSAATVSNPSTATYSGYLNGTSFGDDYSSSMTVTTVKIATEKTGYWNVSAAAESNDDGYQLLTALNGLAISDIAAGTVAPNTFNTDADGTGDGTTERNTIAVRALVL